MYVVIFEHEKVKMFDLNINFSIDGVVFIDGYNEGDIHLLIIESNALKFKKINFSTFVL